MMIRRNPAKTKKKVFGVREWNDMQRAASSLHMLPYYTEAGSKVFAGKLRRIG